MKPARESNLPKLAIPLPPSSPLFSSGSSCFPLGSRNLWRLGIDIIDLAAELLKVTTRERSREREDHETYIGLKRRKVERNRQRRRSKEYPRFARIDNLSGARDQIGSRDQSPSHVVALVAATARKNS